jgi:hypothetical protein
MRIKKLIYYSKFAPLLILLLSLSFGFKGDNKSGKNLNKTTVRLSKTTSGKVGDGYRMNVNNLNIPINNAGVIADVSLPDGGTTNGYYGNHGFLFSGGFYLSGKSNGNSWANAVASASLEKDYVPGTVEFGQADPRAQIYVLNSQDQPFGQSWQDWKDAVALGADFYDGNNDGVYDPVDINGNGKWDPDEDAPDLLGDETAWCVYNDGLPTGQRRWSTVSPLGIEIRQTVFAFASSGAIGNLLFVRYRIKYVGLSVSDPEMLDDVYFGVWADPDVGEVDGFNHNLVGSDTTRNAGYTYLKDASPADWGNQPPCFLIDFFSGPAAYIPNVTFTDSNGNGIFDEGEEALDTAYSIRGTLLGIQPIPGAKNQPISSFVQYINGDAVLRDPNNATEARNLMLGLSVTGETVDPCTWSYGNGSTLPNCADIDPRFWYSGDPVAGTGWLNTDKSDVRQMSNTGPFTLRKGKENEIVAAYVVGQGANPVNSVFVTKQIDDGAQFIFDQNFVAPSPAPPVNLQTSTGEEFIDLLWETATQVSFSDSTEAYNDHFEGFNIYAYKSNTTAVTVNNQPNRELVARYTARDFISDIYSQNANTGGIELLYEAPDSIDQLSKDVYGNPQTGRIRLRITEDPFTGAPLVKGKPYYFSITSYSLNYYALVYKDDPTLPLGTRGDYYIDSKSFVGLVENIPKITVVTMAEDLYTPPVEVQPANRISGHSKGAVGFDIIDNDQLNNDLYEVTFFKRTGATFYNTYWRLTDVTTNTILVDSSLKYTYGNTTVSEDVVNGFIPRIDSISAEPGTPEYEPASSIWYDSLDLSGLGTGVSYIGQDLHENGKNIGKPPQLPGQFSTQIHADDIRRVELRFGQQGVGKAYRYINGYKGGVFQSKLSYSYASSINPDDTVGRGPIGNWDLQNDRPNGWVDVPFTAWLVDPEFSDQEVQLTVGFLERRSIPEYPNGTPDGVWDPTDSVIASGEYIFIFNTPYDPAGNQIEYTGGTFNLPSGQDSTVWADLIKTSSVFLHRIPDGAVGVTQEQRDIYNSPFFNTLYVVGLQRRNANSFYTDGDKLVIPVAIYPYTNEDVYQFQTSTTVISSEQEKQLWDKVNVFPNPLYGFNPATSYTNSPSDDPFITFSNLPTDITITIYSLSGLKLRTLTTTDKPSPTSPFLQWDLKNDSGVRVASGLYIAIVNSPKYGQKILKFTLIMPQKQLQKY